MWNFLSQYAALRLALLAIHVLMCMATIESQSLLSRQSLSSTAFSQGLEKFHPIISILDAKGIFQYAVAPLDTLCDRGNWISIDLVRRLGLDDQILRDFPTPNLMSGTGQMVKSMGTIFLHWRWVSRGKKIHYGRFFVLDSALPVDVIFGIEFIIENNLLTVNEGAFMPLVADKPPNKVLDEQLKKQAWEKALQERLDLARRKAARESNGDNSTSTHATA